RFPRPEPPVHPLHHSSCPGDLLRREQPEILLAERLASREEHHIVRRRLVVLFTGFVIEVTVARYGKRQRLFAGVFTFALAFLALGIPLITLLRFPGFLLRSGLLLQHLRHPRDEVPPEALELLVERRHLVRPIDQHRPGRGVDVVLPPEADRLHRVQQLDDMARADLQPGFSKPAAERHQVAPDNRRVEIRFLVIRLPHWPPDRPASRQPRRQPGPHLPGISGSRRAYPRPPGRSARACRAPATPAPSPASPPSPAT